MLDAIPPILLVEVDDALGVAMRAVGVAQSDELLAKRQVIVDFSIEDDPNGAVLVAEGLVPSGEVHTTQPGWPSRPFQIPGFQLFRTFRYSIGWHFVGGCVVC